MAAIAASNIVNITRTISSDASKPIAFGGSNGLVMEVFRIAAGGAQTDTAAITPQYISDIRMVESNVSASDNLSTTAANTNVTLTLGIVGTAATATIGAFQVRLVGRLA
jgi:hypothetical protein